MSSVTRFLFGVAVFSLLAFSLGPAKAADYPTKPITLVSPYGPGGAADLAARTVASTASTYLGQPLLVVNKTGAAGVTGSFYVVRSRPNGYTLLLARVGSQAGVPAINPNIPYKWDQFSMLGLLERNPFVLVVNGKSDIKTFADFEKALKDGKKLSYGSAGVGTLLHIAAMVMADSMGIDPKQLRHIPYKGGGKARAAIVGGHVDFMWQNLSGVIGAIESGQLRALAVTTDKRVDSIKDVPTVAELKYPKMEAIIGWSAIYGPPKLPDPVVAKWVDTLDKLKTDKAWVKFTKQLGSVPDIRSPAETKAFVENQYMTFKDVVTKLGITIGK